MHTSNTKFPQNMVIIFLSLSLRINKYKCDFAIKRSSFCACSTKNTQNLFQVQSPLYWLHSTEDNKRANSVLCHYPKPASSSLLLPRFNKI
jgi:hypothetical protein